MLRLIVRRVLWSVPLLLVATALAFVLVSLLPGDAARTLVGPNATEAQYESVRAELGLDAPLPLRYLDWLTGAVQGDLGHSTFNGEPVTTLLGGRVGTTLALITLALLLATLAGTAAGTAMALRGGRVVEAVALLGLALPSFWIGLLLLDWFPRGSSFGLAVLTTSFGATALIAVQVRDNLLDALNADYVKVLLANGFGHRSVILRHALRNAAIPVVTVLGVIFTGLLTSTVLVENVFTLTGLGQLAVRATLDGDLPVVQGVVVVFTLVVIAVNLLVDLAYGWLDPRVRAA